MGAYFSLSLQQSGDKARHWVDAADGIVSRVGDRENMIRRSTSGVFERVSVVLG